MKLATLIVLVLFSVSVGCNHSTEPSNAQETTGDESGMVETESNAQDAPTATDDARLQKYFERYCDYTGGMGIGFVASHIKHSIIPKWTKWARLALCDRVDFEP